MAEARAAATIGPREEQRMTDFVATNWLWIVLIAAMVFMHRGGHGGHGHGTSRSHNRVGGASGPGRGSHR